MKNNFKLTPKIKRILVAFTAIIYLSAFSFTVFNDDKKTTEVGPEDWQDYKSWTKITKTPNTGDPTGFLSNKHGLWILLK